jgi:hypothetical protein
MYDRIMILPTSVAPRNPPPTTAAPIFSAGPGGIVRPIVPRQAEDQNGNDDDDAAQGNDGVPLARPVPIPRPAGMPVGGPVAPPIAVAPDNIPPPQQTPAVVVTPSNPFGLPPGSSARPGVITPAPQTPPQAPPRSGPQN